MFKHSALSLTTLGLALLLQCGDRCWSATADEHFRRALQLRFQGDSGQAVREYKKGLEENPNVVDAHIQLGTILMEENGDLDGAISEFVTALGIDPQCMSCSQQLEEALRKRNTNSSDQIARGNQFYGAGDMRRALGAYRLAIHLNNADASAHNSLAWTLYRLGSLDEGMKEVREALRLKPDDSEFVNTLASLQFDQGDLKSAWDNFKRAISLNKTPNPADLYGLAAISITRGDTTSATNYFKEALKIDPKYDDMQYLRDKIGISVRTLSSHDRLVSLVNKR